MCGRREIYVEGAFVVVPVTRQHEHEQGGREKRWSVCRSDGVYAVCGVWRAGWSIAMLLRGFVGRCCVVCLFRFGRLCALCEGGCLVVCVEAVFFVVWRGSVL